MYRQEKIILSVVLLMLLIAFFSCGCNLQKSKPCSKYGGTLRWGDWNKSKIINPLYTHSGVYNSVFNLVFDSLLRLDKEGNIEGNLAGSWDISKDNLCYTFYLRKGILFHDGVELTAGDVKFTYDAIRNPVNKACRYKTLQNIADIIVIDKYTLQISLKKPSIPFLYTLISYSIVPKHLFEGKKLIDVAFRDCMIGTGVFVYDKTEADGTVVLRRNENYHGGRAYLDKIVFKLYASQDSCYSALLRKEVDFMLFLNLDQKSYLEKDAYFRVYNYPSEIYTALLYNIEGNSVLESKKVREAISYAINREELIDVVEKGNGVEAVSLLRSDVFKQLNTKQLSFDIFKAMQLFKEAGFENTENGWMKDGQVLELKIAYNSNIPTFLTIVKILRQQLSKLDIRLKTFAYDKESDLSKEVLKKENIDILLFSLSGQSSDLSFALQFLSSEYRAEMKYWSYKNEEINDLFRQGISLVDAQSRGEIYQQINRLVIAEKLIIFLYYPYVSHVVKRQFKNCDDFFNVDNVYYFLKDWFIQEGELKK